MTTPAIAAPFFDPHYPANLRLQTLVEVFNRPWSEHEIISLLEQSLLMASDSYLTDMAFSEQLVQFLLKKFPGQPECLAMQNMIARRKQANLADDSLAIVDKNEYIALMERNHHHLQAIETRIKASQEKLEGNCFYLYNTYHFSPLLINKQRNLYSMATSSDRILEVGFNAGHSSLLMLLANPKATIVAFDLCEHAYVHPCLDYLNEQFGHRIELIAGDSETSVPAWGAAHPDVRFDLMHIDGCHLPAKAHQDFIHCSRLAHDQTLLIWDDTQFEPLWNLLLQYEILGEVQILSSYLPTILYRHAIARMQPSRHRS